MDVSNTSGYSLYNIGELDMIPLLVPAAAMATIAAESVMAYRLIRKAKESQVDAQVYQNLLVRQR